MVGNGSGANVRPYFIEGPGVDREPCVDDAAGVSVVELERGGLGASRRFVGAVPHAIQDATRSAGEGFSVAGMWASVEGVRKRGHEGANGSTFEVAGAISRGVAGPFPARGDVVEEVATGSA